MPRKESTPKSLKSAKDLLLQGAWRWTARRSPWVKLFLGIGGLAGFFILAQIQFFGEPGAQLTRLFVPWEIPGLDAVQPLVSIDLAYSIEEPSGRHPGRLGDSLRTGDRVVLEFRTSNDAWVTVFGVDRRGLHAIFGEGLEPLRIEKDQAYARAFTLDSTVGPEVYYAVASPKRFEFKDEIDPRLRRAFPGGHIKGPVFLPYELHLSSQYAQDSIYFEHLPH